MVRLTLWIFVILLGLDLGAGIYEARIVVPLWANGVPDTLAEGNPFARVAINAGIRFWAVTTPAVGLFALLTLIFSAHAPSPERAWRMGSAVAELCAIGSTLLYFRPTLIRLFMGHGEGMTGDEVRATVHRWVALSRVRIVVTLAAWGAALVALTL